MLRLNKKYIYMFLTTETLHYGYLYLSVKGDCLESGNIRTIAVYKNLWCVPDGNKCHFFFFSE